MSDYDKACELQSYINGLNKSLGTNSPLYVNPRNCVTPKTESVKPINFHFQKKEDDIDEIDEENNGIFFEPDKILSINLPAKIESNNITTDRNL